VGQGDAPVITLVDSAGAPVTSLKAGSYTINVKDLSTHHDFHLTGTGVDQKTSVPDTKDVTWTVKLVAGTYTFKCDRTPRRWWERSRSPDLAPSGQGGSVMVRHVPVSS